MKQVIQQLKTGHIRLVEMPDPSVKAGHLLIKTQVSAISSGTEKMLLKFGKSNLVGKALQQPDQVKRFINKIKTDGILATIGTVQTKLDEPKALGNSNAGVVIEVGENVKGFQIGDRVVSNGCHGEIVCVPEHLCAKIPKGVAVEEAAFTTIASIALNGIQHLDPKPGERIMVMGAGLIGLIAIQLLKTYQCEVLATDVNESRLEMARGFGAETVFNSSLEAISQKALSFTEGKGVDGVLITAAGKGSEMIHAAAEISRNRGRIVLIGMIDLELSRDDFYRRELTFKVSRAYGSGSYQDEREVAVDLFGARRNFETILGLLAEKKINFSPLTNKTFPFSEGLKAYETLSTEKNLLGILLTYGGEAAFDRKKSIILPASNVVAANEKSDLVLGVIGAGNFAGAVLIPALKRAGLRLKTIASEQGMNGSWLGRKFSFENAVSDAQEILNDPEINVVVIATRHNTHANLVVRALNAGKHVFVEKPLAINQSELQFVQDAHQKASLNKKIVLAVDFNRRFSPFAQKAKELLEKTASQKVFAMTVNAGFLPSNHWTQSEAVGGGRIIGEGCHFIDLLCYLAGSRIQNLRTESISTVDQHSDTISMSLNFEDGSMGTIHYLANGNRSFMKERLEVFCEGGILQLNNFCELRGFGWPGFKRKKSWRQDKGHDACIQAFVDAVDKKIDFSLSPDEIFHVSDWTIKAAKGIVE